MGLLRALIILIISVVSVNILMKQKKYIENIPILNFILKYFEGNKCYIIISAMTLLMIIF